MTFSRPAIERLIATVESGLQYGELGPYASALRECLDEVERLTAERLGWVCEVDQLSKQVAAITESVGTERDCGRLRARIRSAHAERDAARTEVARLTAERDASYAKGWNEALDEALKQVDAWRAGKAGT